MFYTEIGLTQYEMHDPVSFLDRYNKDMRIITTTATVAAGRVDLVEQDSKDRDKALQDGIDTNHNDIVNNANDISELKAKDTELEGRIDLNTQDIAALQVTTTSISAQLLSHIETSTSFAAGVMQKVEDNYTELKTDIMADRERISVAEVAISNIQQGDTEIAGRVTALEADNTQNKNAIAALEQVDQTQGESIQDLRGRMTTAESSILTNSNDITSLDGRVETAEQNIEDLQETKIDTGLGDTGINITNSVIPLTGILSFDLEVKKDNYYSGIFKYNFLRKSPANVTAEFIKGFKLTKNPSGGPKTVQIELTALSYDERSAGDGTVITNMVQLNQHHTVYGDDLAELNQNLQNISLYGYTEELNKFQSNQYLKYLNVTITVYGES